MKPMVYTKHLGKDRHKLEMAPMVDVVFQLLIFFLVATQVRPTEADFKSMLPPASGKNDPKDKDKKETVFIYLVSGDKPGYQYGFTILNGQGPSASAFDGGHEGFAKTMAQLNRDAKDAGKEEVAVINAEAGLKFKFVTQTMDLIMGAGIETVTFAKPEDRR